MKKTGFRNGALFCFNCGGSYEMPVPQPVTMASALMKQFDKDHKDCKQTWTEPTNEVENKTVVQNANWWAENGEHGMSSKTMFNHLSSGLHISRIKNDYPTTPSDPDDFRRCYLLLKAVPQWKEKSELERLKTLSKVWANLVDNWDKLEEMLKENLAIGANGMYEFMKELGC